MKVFSLKSFLLFAGVIFFQFAGFSQPGYRVFDFVDPSLRAFSLTGQVGISSYFGDLCATGDCYTQNKPSIGLGATVRLNDYFFFNFNGIYYRIESSDAESANIGRLRRNLSFRADNYEFNLLGNFEFLNYNSFRFLTRKEFPLSGFVFAGIGLSTNNPKTLYNNEYVELRPLQTEGVAYSPVTMLIPFGLGVGYRFTEFLNINLNLGYRYTFSDYLDDVSTTYTDPSNLTSDLAQQLHYRSDEVPGLLQKDKVYGKPGDKRGNPDSRDGYLIIALKAEYKIPKIRLSFINRLGGGSGGPKGGGAQPSRKAAKRRK
jgi:hypothetical protein